MLFSSKTVISFLLLATTEAKIGSPKQRELSYSAFHTFTPITQVTDHAAIDLDQQEIENLIAGDSPQYGAAQAIYENGGHSKSYAVLTVPDGLPTSAIKGAEVSGTDQSGNTVTGKVYDAANAGATTLEVQYTTEDDQAKYVGCSASVTGGCFANSGTLDITGNSITYTKAETRNGRTIQGFSLDTDRHRRNGSGDFYPDFDMFQKYYGATDYADKWISAALSKTSAGLTNGNANFAPSADEGRVEAVKKGTAYMSIFMYVIRELEDAIDDCNAKCDRDECNDDAVHALDEAVAFYSGSLKTSGNDGILLWALAQKRCKNFGTCNGDVAGVNEQIFTLFNRMQDNLLKQDCDTAEENKAEIADLMYVPMVQGTLRYAYFSGVRNDQTEKSEAEGATFAAAVLPKLHMCNEKDAETVYNNMKIGNTSPVEFDEVKRAFERNYKCMGITCADVGGLTDGADYFEGAAPCSGSIMFNVGLAIGMAAAAVAVLF